MFLSILLLNCALFLTINFTQADKCRKIDLTYLPTCANVGYNFTANFSNIGEKSYQEHVSSEVALFTDRFNSCSPYARMFVCSRYVPKCSEGVESPVLPCREVCEQFVDDCDRDLKDSGLYKRYVAYCRLLSSEKEKNMQCLKPNGFVSRPNRIKEPMLPSCETASQPACLKDNFSGLENTTRTRLLSSLIDLFPVLSSNCSLKLKRFACFIETAPCVTSDGSTLHACPSMCQEVRRDCAEEFRRHNIFFPQCIPYNPEVAVGNGLCQLSQWPVPWPHKTGNRGRPGDHVPETTPRSPEVVSKPNRDRANRESKIGTTDKSKPDGNKETKKKPLSSGVLAVAVVGFLIIFFLVTLLLHLFVKKLKKNAKARRRGTAKYVNDKNISANGKAVMVGEKNNGFEEEIHKTGSALY